MLHSISASSDHGTGGPSISGNSLHLSLRNAKSQQEREAMGEQGQAKFGNESPVKFPSSAFSEVDSTARLGDGRL